MSQKVTVVNDEVPPITPPAPSPPSPPQSQHTQASTRQPNTPREAVRTHRKPLLSCFFTLKEQYSTKARLAAIGLVLGLVSLLIAIITLAPSFKGTQYGKLSVKYAQESIALDAWQANATFRAWCQDEEDDARTLSSACEDVLRRPLPPPPPHTRRALMRTLIKNTHLLWHGGRRVVDRSISYIRILGRFVITGFLGLCLWKYSKRPLGRMIRAVVQVGHENDLLPFFLRREYRETVDRTNATLPRTVSTPPRSSTTTSAHQMNTSSTDLSSFQSSNSELRRRDPPQKQQPVARKPLPPAMQEYLAKVYSTNHPLEKDKIETRTSAREDSFAYYGKSKKNGFSPLSARDHKKKMQIRRPTNFSTLAAEILSEQEFKINIMDGSGRMSHGQAQLHHKDRKHHND
ncbi:hypothetical protein BDV96DRAFT_376379 [Lophiotrema nucula]|uniref:Transmembrane protein n=1 Tax=Lophiotrema nucula TaxID=690887 RepID=A0A6A5YGN7_9PLEO|nr:hypothetical protein BDV96DRAFT_376379 [Lophiotrema nucula]